MPPCYPQVRSVLIQRASDVRYDPPLLAACARDIVAQCEEVGQDTTRVFGCELGVDLHARLGQHVP